MNTDSYTEFIKSDKQMDTQRTIHVLLSRLTSTSIKMGMAHTRRSELGLRRIYSKLFPPSTDVASKVSAHRLKLHIRDRNIRSSLEEVSKITSLSDPSIASVLNYCFLSALLGEMAPVVHEMLRRGFPTSVNNRVLGTRKNALFPTYFHMALATQNTEIIMSFFRRTVDVMETWHGLGPLHLAVLMRDTQPLQILLAKGSDPLVYTSAVQSNLISSLRSSELAKSIPEFNRPIYPVDLAALVENWAAVEILIAHFPSSLLHSQFLLHTVSNVSVAVKAVNAGASTELLLPDGSSLLHTMARNEDHASLLLYLLLGLSPGARDRCGRDPLSIAAELGDCVSAWLLLAHGASVPDSLKESEAVRKVTEGGWRPEAATMRVLEAAEAEARKVKVVEKKKKSRFRISRLLYPRERTVEKLVLDINTKLKVLNIRAEKEVEAIQEEKVCDVFSQMVSRNPKKDHEDGSPREEYL